MDLKSFSIVFLTWISMPPSSCLGNNDIDNILFPFIIIVIFFLVPQKPAKRGEENDNDYYFKSSN